MSCYFWGVLKPYGILSVDVYISLGLRLGLVRPCLCFGLGLLGLLYLEGRESQLGALAAGHGLPEEEVLGEVPGQQADPGLDVVVQLQGDVCCLGNLAGRMCDLILGLLVLELELAATKGKQVSGATRCV